MRITTLREMKDWAREKPAGETIAFLNDLRDPETEGLRYLVVFHGILDLNGKFDVVPASGSILDEDILVITEPSREKDASLPKEKPDGGVRYAVGREDKWKEEGFMAGPYVTLQQAFDNAGLHSQSGMVIVRISPDGNGVVVGRWSPTAMKWEHLKYA